jgi:hypothetical protein
MKILQNSEDQVFDIRTLRLLIGAIALAFPTVAYLLAGRITTSISASYHEPPARDVFVGFLFILGALLLSYKGHRLWFPLSEGSALWMRIKRDQEDWISGIGGIAAISAALFPTACDDCSFDTTVRIHTIGGFLLFSTVVYFSLIAFLRSLNLKFELYHELKGIDITPVRENGSLARKFTGFLFSHILLFVKIVAEVSNRYDREHRAQKGKFSFSYGIGKLGYLLTAHRQKIRRGFIYMLCGSLIFVILVGYLLMALILPDLVTSWKLTFVVEAMSLWLFGVAWMTAGHIPFLRKLRLLWVLRRPKTRLAPQLGGI